MSYKPEHEAETTPEVFYPGETYIDDNPVLLEAYEAACSEGLGAHHFVPEQEDATEIIEANRLILEHAGALDDFQGAREGRYGDDVKHAFSQFVGHSIMQRSARERKQKDNDLKTVLGFVLNGLDDSVTRELSFAYGVQDISGSDAGFLENLPTAIGMHPLTIERDNTDGHFQFRTECAFILASMLTPEVRQFVKEDTSRPVFVTPSLGYIALQRS